MAKASRLRSTTAGRIRVGIGGWTFEPWRGVFYPEGLTHKRELEFASRAMTSIEINGTYYSSFKPDTWMKWHDETPDDFVFSVKASRYCTSRRVLAEAGPSIEKFLAQGLTALGAKLGPIEWQLAPTKKLDLADMERFLALLPPEQDGVRLRHALEVRHPSFDDPAFHDLARRHEVAIVSAEGEDHPEIDVPTAPFTYARLMIAAEDCATGVDAAGIERIARRAQAWAERGDVFLYFIGAAKVRNPAAAQALIARLTPPPAASEPR